MVEVFITDLKTKAQAEKLLELIKAGSPGLKLNFDLSENDLPFPCGHTVIRAEGVEIDAGKIIDCAIAAGYCCEIMKDELCNK